VFAARSKAALVRSASLLALAGLVSLFFSGFALGEDADDNDEPASAASAPPNIYLDLRTNYATVPAYALSTGLGNSALFTTLQTIQTLTNLQALTNLPALPTLPALSSPSSQSIGVDVPLTVDFNDRVSAYGGFSGSATRTDLSEPAKWRIDSNHHAAIDGGEIGTGFPAGHDFPQRHSRV
jgi:hypothetical protein